MWKKPTFNKYKDLLKAVEKALEESINIDKEKLENLKKVIEKKDKFLKEKNK